MGLLNKAREFFGFGRTRCKSGDLAVVVNKCDVSGDYLVGRVFRLINGYSEDGEAYWEYEGPMVMTPWGPLLALADEVLLPIRSDGITDEEVSSLYQSNPTKQGEHA